MRLLGSQDLVMSELVKSSIKAMGPQYPELVSDSERITAVAQSEEDSFIQTLKSGTSIFDLAADQLKKSKSKALSADTAFKLHDTYGFPLEVTEEIVNERDLSIDIDGFNIEMDQQRQRAKAQVVHAEVERRQLARVLAFFRRCVRPGRRRQVRQRFAGRGQRVVDGGGRLSTVRGSPSGPITCAGRIFWFSIILSSMFHAPQSARIFRLVRI